MAYPLRYNTASQEVLLGPFVDETDGKTAETGLTIANTDIRLHKHGGTTHVDKNSGGATHDASGCYYATLDATDTNTVGGLIIDVHVSGALPVRLVCHVYSQAAFDFLFGTTALPVNTTAIAGSAVDTSSAQLGVNVVNWKGSAVATTTVAGVPEVDVTHWIGTAAATPTVAGVPEVDVTHWIGTAAATPTVAGVPEVDLTHWLGTAAATPTVAGVPEVDPTYLNGQSLGGNNAILRLKQIDVLNVGGTACMLVSGTSTAPGVFVEGSNGIQSEATETGGAGLYLAGGYGMNVEGSVNGGIQIAGNPGIDVVSGGVEITGEVTGTFPTIETNVTQWGGSAIATPSVSGVPEVDITHINGGATDGNNATLKLKQIDVTNTSGTAIIVNGQYLGVYVEGGNTALNLTGGTDAIAARGVSGAAFKSTNNGGTYGIEVDGIGLTSNLNINGDIHLEHGADFGVVTGTFPDMTLTSAYDAAMTAAQAGDAMTLTAAYDAAKTAAQAGEMTLSASYDAAKTAASQTSVNAIDSIIDNIHDTDLPAIKTVVDNIHDTDLPAVATAVGDVHSTDLPALKAVVDNLHDTDLPAVKTVVDNIHDTDLPAVKTVVDNVLRWFTNKMTVTDTELILRNDADDADLYTQTLDDDGDTTTRGAAT